MNTHIYKFNAMSTPCEVVLYSDDKIACNTMAEAIMHESKRLEKKYNYYDKESFLSQLNLRQTSTLDPESKSLLQRASKYYQKTEGIFDITLATIKDLYKESLSLKDLEEKKSQLLPFIGCNHFRIKKDQLLFDNAYTKIDLGGFVKEYAVDRAITLLKKKKFTSALVNFGRDISALGSKPTGEAFLIGIKDPKNPAKNITEVALRDQSLTTSASYERNYTIENQVFSHIISAEVTQENPLSVTVISRNCVESGVYSTALMINPLLATSHTVIKF